MMLQRRIFYIADMHFGHKNILKYDKRPFADTGQMDEEIIRRWNERVCDDDTVYVLGDAFFKGEERSIEIMKRLNGHKRSRPQQRQAAKAVEIRQRVRRNQGRRTFGRAESLSDDVLQPSARRCGDAVRSRA